MINLTLGGIIYLRNPHSSVSRSFAGLSVLVSVWMTSNFLTNSQLPDIMFNDIFNRLAFVSSYLTVASGLIFTYFFPVNRRPAKNEVAFIVIMSMAVVALSFTHLIAGTVELRQGSLIFSTGSLLWLFALGCLVLITFIARNLLSDYASKRLEIKTQTKLILFGFATTVILALITNIAIPAISSNWESTRIGPITTVILVASTSYAIVRHRLFDIRLFVLRALAYVFTTGLITIFYLVPAIFLVSWMVGLEITWSILGSLILIYFALVFIYRQLRQLFDKWTRWIFYRNFYDPQEVLHSLSELLVRNTDKARLESASRDIILQAIHAESLEYWLADAEDQETLRKLRELFKSRKVGHIAVMDDLYADLKVAEQLRASGIAAAVRLRTKHDDLGYITLGFKESGMSYNQIDRRFLGIAADEIAIGIQNALHFEEIQAFNRTLQERVQKATLELRHSNQKLKALDETKDDFISMASHQLRTPLTSVKGYISMVLEGDAGKITKAQRDMLNQAYFSSQRMVFLIADLLNVSRLKTGRFMIDRAETNLAVMVEEELEQLRETAAARSLKLHYHKPANFPSLMLDETKTRQVVMNFIDNAIYYTPPGGEITVRLVENPAAVELRVEDNGIGVPKVEQHHLFTKFYRAANARKARPDGTGLGLFMAKKVIVAQGGAIIFSSQEGKGSTFGFTFSKSKLAVRSSKPSNALVVAHKA